MKYPPPYPSTTADGRRTLLLVENIGLAESITPALAAHGWIVRATSSVREAIYTAKRSSAGALVTTLALPDERGDVGFFRIAAEYPWLRRRTVFLVQSDEEQSFAASGGHPWVRVPASAETIVRVVTNVCGDPPR